MLSLVLALIDASMAPAWRVARLPTFLNPLGGIMLTGALLVQERRPILARTLIGVSLLLVIPGLIITVLTLGQPR